MRKYCDIYSVYTEALTINKTGIYNGKRLGNGSYVVCILENNMTEDWMINASRNNLYTRVSGAKTPLLPFIMGVSKKISEEYVKSINEEFPDLKLTILKCNEVF